jgi:hypothetical protein
VERTTRYTLLLHLPRMTGHGQEEHRLFPGGQRCKAMTNASMHRSAFK